MEIDKHTCFLLIDIVFPTFALNFCFKNLKFTNVVWRKAFDSIQNRCYIGLTYNEYK